MPLFSLSNSDGVLVGEFIKNDGPTVMLVSGLGGSMDFWEGVKQQIISLGYGVLSLDQRGIGQSERGTIPLSISLLAEDFHKALMYCGVDHVHVVGHSTGGCIAQQFAVNYPQKVLSVVLGATWSFRNQYMLELFELRRSLLKVNPFFYQQQSVYLSYPAEWIVNNLQVLMTNKNWEEYKVNIMLERIQALLDFDGRNLASKIMSPCLVLGVEDDLVIPHVLQRNLSLLISGAEFMSWERGGHFFPITLQEEYIETLKNWFERF